MPCSKPLPRPCLRASWEDAQMLNKPWPAAKLCIIFDRLDCLQDANQPQIKSSTKLMSNHILSVQLDIITWELIFRRRGKTDFSRWSNCTRGKWGWQRTCAQWPWSLPSSSPSSLPDVHPLNLPHTTSTLPFAGLTPRCRSASSGKWALGVQN